MSLRVLLLGDIRLTPLRLRGPLDLLGDAW